MKNVLVMSYAFSDLKGSEFIVGYRTVTELAKLNNVTAIVGVSEDHLGQVERAKHLAKENIPNLKIWVVEPPRLALIINYLNKKFHLSWAFYVAFYIWHKAAIRRVREEIKLGARFDVTHQLGPIGFREPGFIWELGLPHVWGPIGGAQLVPEILLQSLDLIPRLVFMLKNVINKATLSFSKRVRTAVARSNVLIFSTDSNRRAFQSRFNRTGPVVAEQASEKKMDHRNLENFIVEKTLISIGSIDNRKNHVFLLKVIKKIISSGRKVNYIICGSGPLTSELMQVAEKLGISSVVEFRGQVDRDTVHNLLSTSYLHLMASLSEGNPAVLFESSCEGVPTVSFKKDGMESVFKSIPECLIDIERVSSNDMLVNEYAAGVIRLIDSPDLYADVVSRLALSVANDTWSRRAKFYDSCYESAIQGFKS